MTLGIIAFAVGIIALVAGTPVGVFLVAVGALIILYQLDGRTSEE